MKMIKFVMAKGEEITLPYEQAQKVLNSPQQIVQITDEQGNWTGITINKAHIVCTKEDIEAREDQRTSTDFSLPAPKERNSGMESVDEIMKRKMIKEYMDRMWYTLQKKGVFEGYKTPDEYRRARGMPLLDEEGNWVYPVKDGNGNWVYPEKDENRKETNLNPSN